MLNYFTKIQAHTDIQLNLPNDNILFETKLNALNNYMYFSYKDKNS